MIASLGSSATILLLIPQLAFHSIITKIPQPTFKELDPCALSNFLANFSMGCAIRAKPDLIDSTNKSKNDDDDDDALIIVAEIFKADLNTIAMSEVD